MPSSNGEDLRQLKDDDLYEIDCRSTRKIKDVVDILQKEPNHSSLRILRILGNHEVRIDCARLIANMFQINKSITTFDSGNGPICSDGMTVILEALSGNDNTSLTTLVLRCLAVYDSAIVAMGRMLKRNKSLTELEIRCFFDITSDRAVVIGDALQHNTTLQRLAIYSSSIDDAGAIAIANGIRENDSSSLNDLNLCGNDEIGIPGARSIAAMLTTNKSLSELHLCRCEGIGRDGVIVIAEALQHNQSLTTLALDYIPFGDDGARSIATLLSTNVSLRKLEMNHCHIGDDGAVAIANALRTNQSLECISIRCNAISSSVVANNFAPMLERNATLKEFYLGDPNDPFDRIAEGAKAILQALQEYNDTVYAIIEFADDTPYNNIIYQTENMNEANRKGRRRAPKKAERRRRCIFNGLQGLWGNAQ